MAKKTNRYGLSPEMDMLLSTVAERRGISASDLIRNVLLEWLQSHESHKISRSYVRGKNFREESVSLCVAFPKSEVDRLANIAFVEGRSRSSVVREAIQSYLGGRDASPA